MAFALRRAAPAEGEQPREPAIGGAVGRIGEQARRVAQKSSRAPTMKRTPSLLRRHMSAHHAGQAVAVGDREGREAERRRGDRQLLRMRGAAQEGEIGGRLQLGVGGASVVASSLLTFSLTVIPAKRE